MDTKQSQLSKEVASKMDLEMKLLYLGGMNLREIGERYGVSRQRVHERLCRIGYSRRYKHKPSKIEKIAKRFSDRKDAFYASLVKNGDCLEYSGCQNPITDYGVFTFTAIGEESAHRVAYKLQHGFIPPGACVLHKCDNPMCCNIDHLYLGDHKQNALDRVNRGRGNTQKLSRKQTEIRNREIKKSFALGKSIGELAQERGLSKMSIKKILSK